MTAALVAAWQARRDSWLTSRRIQQWALRWPLLRGVARRRASALFDLCAGFVYSQVLHAVIELEICEKLAASPQSLAALARSTGLAEPEAARLVNAAASLGLVEWRRGDRVGLGPLGAALVGNPMIRAMVAHHDMLYQDLADPVARLRDRSRPGHLKRYWTYAGSPAEACTAESTAAYSALMSASQAHVADGILAAYPVSRHRRWLDVGGGNGELLIRMAGAVPGIRGTCFDVPGVAGQAERRIAESGFAERIGVVGGDMLSDPLPTGHDAALLVRVLHDHDDDPARRILAAVHRALPPGGRLLIAEPMAEPPGRNRVADAYFGLYLLAMGQGRARSVASLDAMVRDAGFGPVREYRTQLPMLLRVLVTSRT